MFNRLKRMREHAASINGYFVAAVKAYLYKEDEAAGFAAFAAGVVAASMQRSGMVAFLRRLSAELQHLPPLIGGSPEEFRATGRMIAKLESLQSQISARDWGLGEIRIAKHHLSSINPEYFDGLNRADPGVFHRRYPDLFAEGVEPAVPLTDRCYCTTCGAEVDHRHSYCGKCGVKQSTQATEGGLGTLRFSSGRTPSSTEYGEKLIQAASQGNAALVQDLLDESAEVNTQDKHGMTALMYAALRRDKAMAHTLLRRGADPNLQNQDGATALITAATHGDLAVVRLLLDHKANPNLALHDETTALNWATAFAHIDIIWMLLLHGAASGAAKTPDRCIRCGAAVGEGVSLCYECRTK